MCRACSSLWSYCRRFIRILMLSLVEVNWEFFQSLAVLVLCSLVGFLITRVGSFSGKKFLYVLLVFI